jgi:ABC-type nitrate/sulfonate/bicarbonate transport system permease component
MQTHFFPSRTMAFYMARLFLVRTFAVLAALVLVSLVGIAIYFIFDLLARRLLGRWHDSELPGR